MSGADVVEIGLGDMDHLVDAAAGRVSFQIPKAIGGAGVETDAAVDAAGEIFVRGILAWYRGGSGHRLSVGAMRNGNTARETRRSERASEFRFWGKHGYPPHFAKASVLSPGVSGGRRKLSRR